MDAQRFCHETVFFSVLQLDALALRKLFGAVCQVDGQFTISPMN